MEKDLNELRDKAYLCAIAHGWHEEELSNDHWLCLVVSELMEAVAADRRNRHARVDYYKERIANSRICRGLDAEISKETGYMVAFDEAIKDTVEDELADACIRILDLAGLRKVNMSGILIFSNIVTKKKSFTENVYAILKDIVNYKYSLNENLNYSIRQIIELAAILGFDLLWHIEQKMKYNELREYKHGDKNY